MLGGGEGGKAQTAGACTHSDWPGNTIKLPDWNNWAISGPPFHSTVTKGAKGGCPSKNCSQREEDGAWLAGREDERPRSGAAVRDLVVVWGREAT